MNFRQIRKKIKTVTNVGKITNAMQMVASVKMKKMQEAAAAGRSYSEILDKISSRVLATGDNIGAGDPSQKASGNLYILVSSNKGLCGSFNFNLFKIILKEVEFKKARFVTVGKKGADFLRRLGAAIIADFSLQLPFIDNVSPIYAVAWKAYLASEYANVYVIYNKFYSTFKASPVVVQLLPLDLKKELEEKKSLSAGQDYVLEPSGGEIISALIEDSIKTKIRAAILDSAASEESFRMMAMKNATDAAGDIIYNLTLLRNRARQASITNELLDIVTAAQVSPDSIGVSG